MKKTRKSKRAMLISATMTLLLVSSCGPGQLFGPTLTPTPTITPSPTPIPGIGTEIIINGIGITVKSATLGGELPFPYTMKSGYILLEIKISFSGDQALDKARVADFVVSDENGNKSSPELYTFSADTPADETASVITVSFGVRDKSRKFSLLLPDGQLIDFMSILHNK